VGALVSIVSILSMSCPFPRVDAVVPVRAQLLRDVDRYLAAEAERGAL